MRRFLMFGLLVTLALPALVHGELGFKTLSATSTSQTFLFSKASANVLICNLGTNVVYFRLFDQNDIPADAANTNAQIVAGTATAPVCISFDKAPTVNAYYSALSVVCEAGQSATVHVEYQ